MGISREGREGRARRGRGSEGERRKGKKKEIVAKTREREGKEGGNESIGRD